MRADCARRTRRSGRFPRRGAFAVGALLVLALGGCGSKASPGHGAGASPIRPNPLNRGKAITIGSKNFPESTLVAAIYGHALARAGYTVRYRLGLGLERVATQALRKRQIDGYPEYVATALQTVLGVRAGAVPRDAARAYALARDLYARRLGLVAWPPTPFDDTTALAVTRATQRRLGGVTTVSQLAARSPGLTVAAPASCRTRADCLPGLQRVYGLRFQRAITVDVAQRHSALRAGRADVSVCFATDAELAASSDEVALRDDRRLFPPYPVMFVLGRGATARLGPAAGAVVARVQRGLTTSVMRELNARVDLGRQDPARVAIDYLRRRGDVP